MPIPFQPSLPAAPCFDATRNAWILSRYEDVSAALRESALSQLHAGHDPGNGNGNGNAQHTRLAGDAHADLARMSTAAWRKHMEETLASRLRQASGRRRMDLVRELIQPWATNLLVTLNGGDAIYSRRLAEICEFLFYGQAPARQAKMLWGNNGGQPDGERGPEQELERMLEGRQLLLSKATFFGLTQTMPKFLAKAWLAVLQSPEQMAKLAGNPKLMPNATEELLRYASVVHTLYRRAGRDVSIGDAQIKEGQVVILEVDAANFDAERFEHPERMDLTRTFSNHLGLGAGAHSCVGSFLVRMACTVGTPLLIAARPFLVPNREVVWTGDKTVLWPMSVPVRFAVAAEVRLQRVCA